MPDPAVSASASASASGDAVRAAGAVLWRHGAGGYEIALVHRPRHDDWSFPKGKLRAGEHLLRAALREVEEETGLRPRLGRRLAPSRYVAGSRPKRVDYWAATAEPAPFIPNDEVDRVEWLPPEAAAAALSHPGDRNVLREFMAGPIATIPLIILRHASAGDKHDWRDDDALRPLDPDGRADARALAGLVSCFGSPRLISSATARCLETVLPVALAQRSEVSTDRAVTIGATPLAGSRARMAELVTAGRPVLVCTHGELVADLIAAVCERLDARPPAEPALPKGGFRVLHLAVGEAGTVTGLAATECHAPDQG